MRRSFAALALLVMAGCAAKPAPPRSPSPSPSPSASADPIFDSLQEYRKSERIVVAPPAPTPPPPPVATTPDPPPCPSGVAKVYVVTDDVVLHSFDPDTLHFTRIGALSCPNMGPIGAGSMAVDNEGRAFVRSYGGNLAITHVADLACRSSRIPSQPMGTWDYGMAFARTGPQKVESLFLAAAAPARLGRIDGDKSIDVGAFPKTFANERIELSSLPDGRLFAFFTGSPATVAEVDPQSAALRSQRLLPGVQLPYDQGAAFAFAAVGSDFFFFWSTGGQSSTITRLKSDGTIDHVRPQQSKSKGKGKRPRRMTPAPRLRIVGAGVPTCVVQPAPQPKPPPPRTPVPIDPFDPCDCDDDLIDQ